MSFQESVRMDEILRYLQGDKPEKLEFDEMGRAASCRRQRVL